MDRVYSPRGGEFDALEGALHALLELHYSVDILAEHQLRPRLAEFPLLVIPDSHRLGPEFQEAVVKYVQDGGSLLLLGEKCARIFQPILGVELIGDPQEIKAELATPIGPVAVKGAWQEVEPTTAEPVAHRYPTRDFRQDGSPAATVVSFGKGKVGAVFGPLALAFFQSHQPGLRLLTRELAASLFSEPRVEVDGPPILDIALRRTADGRLSLHILNRSGFPIPDRHNFIDFVPPVGPVRVCLKLPDRPRSVLWMPDGGKVTWTWMKGRLEATIPSVHVHGILVAD
jgi:hypothetical protein